MALTVIKPSGIDISGNYTVNGMNVSANASIANLAITNSSNLGAVGNVYIGGGSNGQYLQTNGSGVLTWTTITVSPASISNGNSNVNIPTSNGNVNITAVGNTTLVVTGTGANVTGTLNITSTGSFGGNINMNNQWINNVGYPNLSTDVATKSYVDTMVSTGIAYHQPVLAATTTTLATATGGTVSYNNGTSGVGANLTTTGTFLLIDGANVQTAGTRILVKNEANAAWNGVYEYTSTTVITRTSDADEYGPDSTTQLSVNDYFFVQDGTVNKGVAYIVSAPSGTITFGTSNITFAEFSTSQVYSAGTGLTLTGSTFSVNASQTQITSVGTLTGLSVNGDITAANITANTGVFTGNGNGLSSLVGANVTGAVSYATTANSVAGSNVSGQVGNALVAGTVYTAAQPNITSVGTLTGLTSNGVVNFTNTSNTALGAVGNVHITGGTNGQYLQTDGSGNLSWTSLSISSASISNGNSNVNIPSANGNVNISVEGNANVLVITGTGANIAGNLAVTGNISASNISAGSGSGGSITGGNLVSANYIGGTLTTAAQPNITSVGVLSSLSITGNLTAGNATLGNSVTSNYFVGLLYGTANLATYATTANSVAGANVSGQVAYANVANNVAGANVSGEVAYANIANSIAGVNVSGQVSFAAVANSVAGANVTGAVNYATTANSVAGANVSGQVANALVAGTVYTNAQPNITSVGSLTELTVNNSSGTVNLSNTANISLGAVANLHISGGNSGQYLQTDGSGNLTWANASGGGGGSNIANGNSNVSIATANGNITFSAVGNANIMTITGTGANISGYANVTGNVALSGANVTLGNVSNLHITGGSNTYVLSTDGAGNLSWAAASGTSIGVDNFTGNGVQTAYTLTTTPANANATLVSIAGTFQPRTVYTVVGNVITFSSAPPNTAPIEVTTFTSGSGGGGGGGITAQDLLSPFLLMGA